MLRIRKTIATEAARRFRHAFTQPAARSPQPALVLTCYGKVGCSLCDKAKAPVARAVRGRAIAVEWVDIAGDPVLLARWGERIPVVRAGETVLAEGKISEVRLRRALDAFLAEGARDARPR